METGGVKPERIIGAVVGGCADGARGWTSAVGLDWGRTLTLMGMSNGRALLITRRRRKQVEYAIKQIAREVGCPCTISFRNLGPPRPGICRKTYEEAKEAVAKEARRPWLIRKIRKLPLLWWDLRYRFRRKFLWSDGMENW